MDMYKLEINLGHMNTTLHGLTNNEMELGFSELFTIYETELETHGHVQIRNQLGFHEHQFACYH